MSKMVKIGIVVVLILAVVVAIAVRQNQSGKKADAATDAISISPVAAGKTAEEYTPENFVGKGLPALIDIGAGTCIPCKLMAPILEELKRELEGKVVVQFIDLNKFPNAAQVYGIRVMPTQVFYDASGKERFRHEGFYAKEDILAKWKELGVDLTVTSSLSPAFERLAPAEPDNRAKDQICYMCDGDINAKTLVTVQTAKGPIRLCSPHCYFIMYSCLAEDKTGFEKRVSVTDWATDKPTAAVEAMYLFGLDDRGRPTIKAFTNQIRPDQATPGGIVIGWQFLQEKELATRCGFCDRACYPQDAAEVIVDGGLHTWGCCSHCALGVAARMGKDIEVREKDRLTGSEIVIKTFGGKIASLEPKTTVAWFGQRQKPDGTWASAGCFHQGFFTNAENLQTWVSQHPHETGRLISIAQALADKMKLSPEQIQKACKIGECAPK